MASDSAYNVYSFSSEKYEGMEGNKGWQSNTTLNGVQVQSGGAWAPYYSLIKFTDEGFIVRKGLNIMWEMVHPIYKNAYKYTVYVSKND